MTDSAALPLADAATTAAAHDWLAALSAAVQAVDFAAGRALWDPAVVIFGTHRRLEHGLDAAVARQWSNVWPVTSGFVFRMAEVIVLAEPGATLATVVAPWDSTGYGPDGTPFARPGRATLLLRRGADGAWRCVHSHMSLERGVPQESFGPDGTRRPVIGG